MKKAILFLLVLTMFIPAFADIANPDEVDLRIEVLNLDDFEEFSFYIEYQTYYYDMGYQPGVPSLVTLETGKDYETSERAGSSRIYAKNAKGEIFSSEEEVGGALYDIGDGVSYVVDQYEIVKVENGTVSIKHVARQNHLRSGKVKSDKLSNLGTTEGSLPIAGIALALTCLFALLALFRYRNRLVVNS